MSEVHIYDPQVRPESLCGYTGPPGEGDPTCAACIAVDEQLLLDFPPTLWERIATLLLSALTAAAVLTAALAIGGAQTWLITRAVVIALGVLMIAIPIGFMVERKIRPPYLEGEILKEEAHG